MPTLSELPGGFKHVTIEERWDKEGIIVYRWWRFAPQGEWHKEETPFNEIPCAEIKLNIEEAN